jgi:hypothetical protein
MPGMDDIEDDRKPKHPKQRGRPSLGPTARKLHLSLRLSEIESAALRRIAKAKGCSLSDVILGPVRRMLEREAKK